MSSSKSLGWTQFFKDAGLPLPLAKRYSAVFEDNRISRDMLLDLDKEILSEIGISAMGDVINILKHAKKVHSQEVKKKERESMISSSVSASKRPPVVSPHSTTPAQRMSVVSTTSANTATRKKVAKRVKDSHDGREMEVAYIAYVEPAEKELLLKQHPHPAARPAHIYGALEEGQIDDGDSYQEYIEPVSCDEDSQTSYVTAKYETGVKRMRGKLYSDDVADEGKLQTAQQKQEARVIMLPGEGRDIFTTNALQKAAKVYESGGAQEGVLNTERSMRLLESAGLIPSNVDPEPSVFSRLDYETPVLPRRALSQLPSSTLGIAASQQPPHQRIIQLSKPASTSTGMYSDRLTDKPSLKKRVVATGSPSYSTGTSLFSKRTVVSVQPSPRTGSLYSDTIGEDGVSSSALPIKKRMVSTWTAPQVSSKLASSRRVILQQTPSDPYTITVKGNMVSDQPSRALSTRLGMTSRRKSPASISSPSTISRLRNKPRSTQRQDPIVSSSVSKRTGVFGYEAEEEDLGRRPLTGAYERPSTSSYERPSTSSYDRPIKGSYERPIKGSYERPLKGAYERPTMVADEYQYQALRQRDIRSRLERKEQEKAARRGGPLAGRLGTHEVFMRLE